MYLVLAPWLLGGLASGTPEGRLDHNFSHVLAAGHKGKSTLVKVLGFGHMALEDCPRGGPRAGWISNFRKYGLLCTRANPTLQTYGVLGTGLVRATLGGEPKAGWIPDFLMYGLRCTRANPTLQAYWVLGTKPNPNLQM